MTPITLDFSNMVRERLGVDGIDPDRLGGDMADGSVRLMKRSSRLGVPVKSDFSSSRTT